jgi:adenylate cyclase class 2
LKGSETPFLLILGEETLVIKAPSKIEHKLVELKAKVEDLGVVREKLTSLGAQHVGTFRQIDVYFDVPEGRLKLREVEGDDKTELIYYQRENIAEPKRSDVFILRVQEPAFLKPLLSRLLKIKATVEKVRENYRYRGTQIHLDMVKNLGTFLEFERETSADAQAIRSNRQVLGELMEKLGIGSESLEELSYSDLIQT